MGIILRDPVESHLEVVEINRTAAGLYPVLDVVPHEIFQCFGNNGFPVL